MQSTPLSSRILGLFLCSMALIIQTAAQTPILAFLPRPQEITLHTGHFRFTEQTLIYSGAEDSVARAEAGRLVQYIFELSGVLLHQTHSETLITTPHVSLYSQARRGLPSEGYLLVISSEQVDIFSEDGSGLFYGLTSLMQLFPGGGLPNPPKAPFKRLQVPNLLVRDYPNQRWRGMHLDVCRHFFAPAFIKRYLDYLAWCKLNIFHWHLTDSQGWRMESKRYPLLTSLGAFRVQRKNERFSEAQPGQPGEVANYGGFYTRQDIKEIIEYAAKRHITVVPEIDMPGHSQAALVAYPQFSILAGPLLMPSGSKGAYENSFNPGYDSTYVFLQNILEEVIQLFPSPYIHIGGDEVDRTLWNKDPRCIERMKREHLPSVEALQSYFTKRIERYIASKGRRMVGWDEILQGGLAPGAVVMSWRGDKGGIKAIQENHEAVMAPNTRTYFDLYQGDPKQEPEAYSVLTLTSAYQFVPTPAGLSSAEKKLIIGGEGCLWTETITSDAQAEYMLFPRILALSESLWDPEPLKNWADFKVRLPLYFSALSGAGIHFASSVYAVKDMPLRDSGVRMVKLSLFNELQVGSIYYTTDGSDPGLSSLIYLSPLEIEKRTVIKMATFDQGVQRSAVLSEMLSPSMATSRTYATLPAPSKKFSSIHPFPLTDAIRGSDNPLDGRWNGFRGPIFKASVDLGQNCRVRNFGMDFLIRPRMGVYGPSTFAVEYSIDGNTYVPLIEYTQADLLGLQTGGRLKIYREFSPFLARYFRIKADIPPPVSTDSDRAYLLTDEISID